MIELIPWSPFAITGAAALFFTCAFVMWRDRRMWPVVAVMLGNWLMTRAVSAFELPGLVQAATDLTSAMVLFFVKKDRELLVLPASALFAMMVFFSALHDIGTIERDTLWAWSDVLGYLQLVLIIGGAAAGGGHRGLAMAYRRPGRSVVLGRLVESRIQTRKAP